MINLSLLFNKFSGARLKHFFNKNASPKQKISEHSENIVKVCESMNVTVNVFSVGKSGCDSQCGLFEV